VTTLLVSQQVIVDPHRKTRCDALDQRWSGFLRSCGLIPLCVPNHVVTAAALVDTVRAAGVLLTGGNDLLAYGGDAPERDATEDMLLDVALERKIPVLGVCRGMQVVLHRFGHPLRRVAGHVMARQDLTIDGRRREVNSFHKWAASEVAPPLASWVTASDGVIKAVRHVDLPLLGIMWHPERIRPFAAEDRHLFLEHFLGVEHR
jgi:putative glutamine amidotransferase